MVTREPETSPSSPPTPEREQPTPTQTWRQDALAVGGHLGPAVLAGFVGGLVIGGIGSRLAMLVLRFTSGDAVVGVTSDDGFEIGRLSGSTAFLLVFGAALGVGVGILYLLCRSWIPQRWRVPAFAVLGGLVGGSEIVHADGIDFFLLEPVWLAVLMFVALPAVGGAAIAAGVERLLARGPRTERHRPWLVFLPLLGLLVLGPVGLAIMVAVPLGIAANQKVPLVRIWTSEPMAWIGCALLAGWAVVAGVALINDLRGIFGG